MSLVMIQVTTWIAILGAFVSLLINRDMLKNSIAPDSLIYEGTMLSSSIMFATILLNCLWAGCIASVN